MNKLLKTIKAIKSLKNSNNIYVVVDKRTIYNYILRIWCKYNDIKISESYEFYMLERKKRND